MKDKADTAMPAAPADRHQPGHPHVLGADVDGDLDGETDEIFHGDADDGAWIDAPEADEAGVEAEQADEHAGDPEQGCLFDDPPVAGAVRGNDGGLDESSPPEPESHGAAQRGHAAPVLQPRVHGGARGAKAGARSRPRGLPSYLQGLCGLPGVDRAGFESIECRTAVIELWATQPRCAHDKLPVAHLAPDALTVLARMRFHGHVRFAVYARDTDREPAFNSAFEMPAEYAEIAQPQAAGADEAYRVEYELRAEIDALKTQIANAPRQQNPIAMFRELLAGIKGAVQEIAEIKAELAEMASLDLSSGGETGDEGGGTGEALLAMVIEKGGELLKSDTAKAVIQWGRKLIAEKTGDAA